MDNRTFDLLIESIDEMKQHMNGTLKLKTTTYEIVEVPEMLPEKIKILRGQMGMTQKVFGKFMGVSTRAVESWEGGFTKPNGPARRMMSILEDDKLASKMTEKFIIKC